MSTKELSQAIANSRRMREKQRVRARKYVKGRPRGRPIKHSGTYYTRPILVSDRLMLKVRKNRLPGEPLGSTLERLIGLAERKNPVASIESYQPKASILDNDEEWNKVWDQHK